MAILDYKKLMLVGLRGEKGEKGDRGEKGEKGDAGNQGMLDRLQADIKDLYLIANATVTGTEEVEHAYTERLTANGLSGLIDGALTRVKKIQGRTVAVESGLKHAHFDSIESRGCNLFDSTNEGFTATDYVSLVSQSKNHITLTQSKTGTYTTRMFPLTCDSQLLVGKPLYINATWTPSGNNTGRITLMWMNEARNKNEIVRDMLASNGWQKVVVPAKPDWATSLYLALYSNWNGETVGGETITYNDIMVCVTDKNERLLFKPYIKTVYKLPTPVELPEYDSILPQEGKIVRATDVRVIDGTTIKVEKSVDLGEWQLYTYTPAEKVPCVYGSQVVPIGWGNDTPANSPGFIKGVYLTNSNYITIGVWFNKAKFLEETGVDVVNSPAAVNDYFARNPLTVCRQLQNPIETAETLPGTYPVWDKGVEKMVQGSTDNSIYGAMPTVKQTYVLIKGV